MDELVDHIRTAAEQVGTGHFLELMRWHRAVAGLQDLDWDGHGAYRKAVFELGERGAGELLHGLIPYARHAVTTVEAETFNRAASRREGQRVTLRDFGGGINVAVTISA